MVRLRLQRFGAKRRPYYRVVAADQRKARNGRFIEQLGTYDPKKEPPLIRLDAERVEYWIDNGAKATDTVWSFVVRMREEAPNVVDLSEEGADEAKREELRRQRQEEIDERRRELADSVELEDEHTGTGDDEDDEEASDEEASDEEASDEEASEDEGSADDDAEQEAEDQEAEEEASEDEADDESADQEADDEADDEEKSDE
jgi:small subunit ribosomal protein S16